MFNKTAAIDIEINAILSKQEFLLKLQTEQVAEILVSIQKQVELNLELRELFSELAASGQQVNSGTIQVMEQMDSSITLASQDLAAILTQATSATDSVTVDCASPVDPPTATAIPEPEITVVTSVTAPTVFSAIADPKMTDLPVNRTRSPSELAYISLFPEMLEMMRWSQQPLEVRQAALDAKVAAGQTKIATENVAAAGQENMAAKKRKSGIEKFREWRGNVSGFFRGIVQSRFRRTRD
ncbi:hypothetical protein HDU80_009376 [Chytriomyces hyalinus]|nr:hypothetical protein HDU80_009376 [Chytriomyces hyalinus]